ncbi:hypothetical protein MUK42_15940 [Musa troglodytarum]|uniref:Uncharacterized protein n=1 Tax=Musa troglodytarum TaxID=320322 RepID=A0A9E7GZC3_9LILI|nr:hypothetical protein MUK42_15940 [Musa troglodytarum]
MPASTLVTRSMVLVCITLLMVTAMKDHGMKARSKVLGCTPFVMGTQDAEIGTLEFSRAPFSHQILLFSVPFRYHMLPLLIEQPPLLELLRLKLYRIG